MNRQVKVSAEWNVVKLNGTMVNLKVSQIKLVAPNLNFKVPYCYWLSE